MGSGYGFQLLIRRLHVLVAIPRAFLSCGIRDGLREEARAGELALGVQDVRTERVDLFGELLRAMSRAQMLAHHGAVLGFRPGVIVGMPRAGLGELEAPRLQQHGTLVLGVRRAIIGLASQDGKRKPLQQLPDDREHIRLAALFAGGNQWEWGHAIHRIAVRDPLPAILIALMHTLDADIARHPLRLGGARRGPMGTPVGRVVVQCRRVRWYGVPRRTLYRGDTEIPASRSTRASPKSRSARSLNSLVAGPDTVPCRASTSASMAPSVAVTRRENASRGVPCRQPPALAVLSHQPGHRLA